jgi:chromosome partitioning protein
MIIATVNAKGGVGKSTIAVHLAVWLHEKGRRVVLVDSDVQSSSALWLADAEPAVPVISLHEPRAVLTQTPALGESYDVVVADGPAGLAELSRALLLVADVALIPCGPSALDLRAATLAIGVVQEAQKLRAGLPNPLLVLNKLQYATRLERDVLDAAPELGISVASTAMYLRQPYADSVGQGSVVWRMGRRGNEAAAELDLLFEEVLQYGRTEKSTRSHRS